MQTLVLPVCGQQCHVPFMCDCFQLEDVEVPAFLIIKQLGDTWGDIIDGDRHREVTVTLVHI